LPVDVGVFTILLFCSRRWLLSYVSPCHENLESRFTTNPPNGAVTGLPTRLLYIKMELEPFFPISWRLPTTKFFSLSLFVPLCLSFSFSSLLRGTNYWAAQGTNCSSGSKAAAATAIATRTVAQPSLLLLVVLLHSHFILPLWKWSLKIFLLLERLHCCYIYSHCSYSYWLFSNCHWVVDDALCFGWLSFFLGDFGLSSVE
jgi:hypothetical protein